MDTPVDLLSRDEVERLLAHPDRDDVHGLRDAAVLATLYYAAATAMEVAGLDLRDLRPRSGRLVLRGEETTRRVETAAPLRELLERYLRESRPMILVHAGVADPKAVRAFFLGNRGQRIRVQELRQIFGATAKAVGLHMHHSNLNILRLSRAWHLREEGMRPERIQRFLGATSRSGRRVI